MRRERIEGLEKSLNAGFDSWRDRWFVYWPGQDNSQTDADLAEWQADFPNREPNVLRVKTVSPEVAK